MFWVLSVNVPPTHAHLRQSLFLALAPLSVVLTDGGAPAVHALAPLSVVHADGGAPAGLALAPLSVVLAEGLNKPLLLHSDVGGRRLRRGA
jgi:hypothetical protein